MKSQILLFLQQLLTEVGNWCNVSTARDFKKISERVENEGLSFLAITLPAFGKDFEKALAQGLVTEKMFQGYARQSLGDLDSPLPKFLGGFLSRIFDSRDGTLVDMPDLLAIRAIRQITLMFAKIKLPTTAKRDEEALVRYIDCDIEVRKWENNSFLDEMRYSQSTFRRLEKCPLHFGVISSLISIERFILEISNLSMVLEPPLSVFRETENTTQSNGQTD